VVNWSPRLRDALTRGLVIREWGVVNWRVGPRSCGTRLRADWGLEIGDWWLGIGPRSCGPDAGRGRDADARIGEW